MQLYNDVCKDIRIMIHPINFQPLKPIDQHRTSIGNANANLWDNYDVYLNITRFLSLSDESNLALTCEFLFNQFRHSSLSRIKKFSKSCTYIKNTLTPSSELSKLGMKINTTRLNIQEKREAIRAVKQYEYEVDEINQQNTSKDLTLEKTYEYKKAFTLFTTFLAKYYLTEYTIKKEALASIITELSQKSSSLIHIFLTRIKLVEDSQKPTIITNLSSCIEIKNSPQNLAGLIIATESISDSSDKSDAIRTLSEIPEVRRNEQLLTQLITTTESISACWSKYCTISTLSEIPEVRRNEQLLTQLITTTESISACWSKYCTISTLSAIPGVRNNEQLLTQLVTATESISNSWSKCCTISTLSAIPGVRNNEQFCERLITFADSIEDYQHKLRALEALSNNGIRRVQRGRRSLVQFVQNVLHTLYQFVIGSLLPKITTLTIRVYRWSIEVASTVYRLFARYR